MTADIGAMYSRITKASEAADAAIAKVVSRWPAGTPGSKGGEFAPAKSGVAGAAGAASDGKGGGGGAKGGGGSGGGKGTKELSDVGVKIGDSKMVGGSKQVSFNATVLGDTMSGFRIKNDLAAKGFKVSEAKMDNITGGNRYRMEHADGRAIDLHVRNTARTASGGRSGRIGRTDTVTSVRGTLHIPPAKKKGA